MEAELARRTDEAGAAGEVKKDRKKRFGRIF
jgi:hypothetical protein